MKSIGLGGATVSVMRKLKNYKILRLMKYFLTAEKNPKNITYEGLFEDFSQVTKIYKVNVGYISEEYLNLENEKVREILSQKSFEYNGNGRDHDLLLILSAIPKTGIRMLDIGSGFGLTFHFLNSHLSKDLEYTGIDLEEVSTLAKKNFANYKNFKVAKISDLINQEFDVVYFGSSLQYFEDYKSTLERALRNSPKIVFISDTPLGHLKSFVTCQVNMKDRKIPRWIFSFSEIDSVFRSNGYELVSRNHVKWHSAIHNFSNFPEEYHHIHHMNLVYSRI